MEFSIDLEINSWHALVDVNVNTNAPGDSHRTHPPARALGLTETAWADRAHLCKETLSRLRRRQTCDFESLRALAEAVGAAVTGAVCSRLRSNSIPARAKLRCSTAGWSAAPCDRRASCRCSMGTFFMQPDRNARPEYVAAFREIVNRIEGSLADVPEQALPVRMYVAGGAALHLYTGERVSRDIDAAFSQRIALPENPEVAYRDADGAARLLYFDRHCNDALGLLHEDAYGDSVALALEGGDATVLDVRLLSTLDRQ